MKKYFVLIMILSTYMFSAQNISLKKISNEIKEFNNYKITALLEYNNILYIGATEKYIDSYKVKFFTYELINKNIVDYTKKLITHSDDTITNIKIDRDNKQLWIETNGLGYISDCYDLNIHIIKNYSNSFFKPSITGKKRKFLKDYFNIFKILEKIDKNSLLTISFNSKFAVVQNSIPSCHAIAYYPAG